MIQPREKDMSTTNVLMISEPETDDVQQIKIELKFLLRRYARSSNHALAKTIYSRMERLLPHLEQLGFQEDRCAFYQMLRCWRLRAYHPELEQSWARPVKEH